MTNTIKDLLNICNISIEAGSIINKYYNTNTNINYKKDKSPVTEADLASNKYIIESLYNLYPNMPILTEESLVEWNIRKNWKTYWLVDPLDGTKEFIKKNNEFTVNIALIDNNEPVMGAIYSPCLSLLYYALRNNGAYKLFSKKKIKSFDNSETIKSNNKKITDKLKIFGSRSHSNERFDNWIKSNFTNYELIKRGSSIKFCEIAEGSVDLYPRFGPTNEWDIAAGHIILKESGGGVSTIDNKKILYNKKENVINPPFLAYCNLIN